MYLYTKQNWSKGQGGCPDGCSSGHFTFTFPFHREHKGNTGTSIPASYTCSLAQRKLSGDALSMGLVLCLKEVDQLGLLRQSHLVALTRCLLSEWTWKEPSVEHSTQDAGHVYNWNCSTWGQLTYCVLISTCCQDSPSRLLLTWFLADPRVQRNISTLPNKIHAWDTKGAEQKHLHLQTCHWRGTSLSNDT